MTLTLRDSLCLRCQLKKRSVMSTYSVKQLAKLAGVSVRTLHLYDEIGLLKPSARTEAGYRRYGRAELLRLQQILFYKELGLPLQEIGNILDDPGFDLLKALADHREALSARKNRISTLIATIDKTMSNLKKGETMLTPEELYEGLPKEALTKWRRQAAKAYGQEAVERSEQALRNMSKADFQSLKNEQQEIMSALLGLVDQDPAGKAVQSMIARHYQNIRRFWGTAGLPDPQAEKYTGLGRLYLDDERFTSVNGKPQPALAKLMSEAMAHFAQQLK